jgi:hypothetical protein
MKWFRSLFLIFFILSHLEAWSQIFQSKDGKYFAVSNDLSIDGELKSGYFYFATPITVRGAAGGRISCFADGSGFVNRIRVDPNGSIQGSCRAPGFNRMLDAVATGLFPTITISTTDPNQLYTYQMMFVPDSDKEKFRDAKAKGEIATTQDWVKGEDEASLVSGRVPQTAIASSLEKPTPASLNIAQAIPQENKSVDQRTRTEEVRRPGGEQAESIKKSERISLETKQREERNLLEQKSLADQTKLQEEEQRKFIERERRLAEQVREMQDQLRKSELAKQELKRQLDEAKVASTKLAMQKPGRHALVIGIDQYQNIPKLRNAVADAKAVANSLKGFDFKVLQLNDLTERSFKQALRDFMSSVSPGDEVVVFYAGHGVQIGGLNYFLPVDTRGDSERQVRDEAINLQRVLDDLSDVKPSFALVIVDACRDNPFKGQGRTIGGRGLSPTTAATGQMIIFSAGANQQALDVLGPSDRANNSVFSRVLVSEMKSPNLSVDRLARNVRTEVVRLAKSVGHEQVPALYDQSIGEFYLNRQ